MTEIPDPTQERLERLEAAVAWLVERERQRQGAPAQAQPPAPRPVRPAAPPKPRKEINPIVWVAAVGSVIALLGAAFFLRWSIERGWLGIEARVLLGILAGLGLSAGAARLILGDGRRIGVTVLLAGLGTLMFSFRVGAFHAPPLFPPVLGFLGTALAVLLAGGLAARAKSGGALATTLAAGLATPLMFSQGGHHEVALAVYLAVLSGAVLAVPYLAKAGATWGGSRWLGLLGPWILLAAAAMDVGREDAAALFALLVLHYLLSGLWIWLPGHREEAKPRTPATLWLLLSLAMTSLSYVLWRRLDLDAAWFAAPVLGFAAVNLLLVKPCRARLAGRQADLALLVLAGGHLALAVPVAMAWRWVGLFWAVFSLLLAWAAGRAEDEGREGPEIRSLRILAFGFAALASLRWMVHALQVLDPGYLFHLARVARGATPFLNLLFLEGALAATAWLLVARWGGAAGILGWIGAQAIGNLALAFELAYFVRWAGGSPRAASITLTVAWALSGAMQWLRGLTHESQAISRALVASGYAWLGLACVKLLLGDLAGVDTPLRALAFLAVGGIFLSVALMAHRARRNRPEVAP
jgi:uncharacterized membrane protein